MHAFDIDPSLSIVQPCVLCNTICFNRQQTMLVQCQSLEIGCRWEQVGVAVSVEHRLCT